MSSPTILQTTLLTSHKGVDLHAATSLLVMKDRLEGGHLLEGLFRCEMHTYRGEQDGRSMARLLDIGRYFNPNKHHYGHFQMPVSGPSWLDESSTGNILNPEWPGSPEGTDLEPSAGDGGNLYDRLLGGATADGFTAVDVVSYPRGQEGPILSGVLWRLVIRGDTEASLEVGSKLAVASGRKEGLLVNPHMESWQAAAR
ncbi:MAG: hypothetical protein KAH56_07625 [Candidatus Krumholzibacteria bacterium]|nr:hypothetical protein [Candidatus Krumholzibacteria bacterium]